SRTCTTSSPRSTTRSTSSPRPPVSATCGRPDVPPRRPPPRRSAEQPARRQVRACAQRAQLLPHHLLRHLAEARGRREARGGGGEHATRIAARPPGPPWPILTP